VAPASAGKPRSYVSVGFKGMGKINPLFSSYKTQLILVLCATVASHATVGTERIVGWALHYVINGFTHESLRAYQVLEIPAQQFYYSYFNAQWIH
jgi:hypothetical protein